MRFQTPLIEARLIRRYKRFLADMELADGRVVTAHCPNPGAMQGLATPGLACWLEPNDDPRRKLGHGWRLVRVGHGMVIVDTALANRIVGEALRAGRVPGLSGPVQAEVRLGAKSRMDFRVGDTFVEVKSVTLARDGWAEFPDSVTTRGARHLQDLTALADRGGQAVAFYLVARDDQTRLRIAADIDPAYARAFDAARAAGVRVLAAATRIDPTGITLADPVLVDPRPQSPPGSGQGGKS